MAKEPVESNHELLKLAAEVLKAYSIVPGQITVIQSGSIKTVWKVSADGRILCLKRLKQSYDKALFSVKAQIYILASGGKVPRILPDRNSQPIVQYRDQLFVLYEWLTGRDMNFSDPADLKKAVQGLAAFHIASKGYLTEEAARVSTKLGKWPEQYTSMMNKLETWKQTAATHRSNPGHSSYLSSVDSVIELCKYSLRLLEKSSYAALTAEGSPSVVLCHQDYGKGNAVLTEQGVYVIDLDGVTYDLPARDLRKIIGKQAENRNHWDSGTINNITNWYTEVHPMSKEEKQVLYIDLLYPHWFYGLVKNQYLNDKAVKALEIERIAKLEQSKVSILEALLI